MLKKLSLLTLIALNYFAKERNNILRAVMNNPQEGKLIINTENRKLTFLKSAMYGGIKVLLKKMKVIFFLGFRDKGKICFQFKKPFFE